MKQCNICKAWKMPQSFPWKNKAAGRRSTFCKACNNTLARQRRRPGSDVTIKQCVKCQKQRKLDQFREVFGGQLATFCMECEKARDDERLAWEADRAAQAKAVADFYAAKAAERRRAEQTISIKRRDLECGKTEWVVRLPGGATLCRAGSYGEALAASSKWLEVRA